MTSLTEIGALGGSLNGGGAATSAPPKELVSSTQFLELLVAQLQNQNPLEPLDGTEYVSQLAEFANLEQLTQVNQGLDLVHSGQAELAVQQSVMMLGREVTYAGNEVEVPAQGTVNLSYGLGAPARDLMVSVFDGNGVKVGEIDSAPRSAGLNTFAWDGVVRTDGGTRRLSEGTYSFEVSAENGGQAIPARTYSSGRVTGITYENGAAQLMLGNKRVGQVVKVTE